MAHIVMADDGIAFDGASAAAGPLGGAETAFVALAEALARRAATGSRRAAIAAPRCATTGSAGRRSRAACPDAAISISAIAATG